MHHSSAACRDDRTMEAYKWGKPFYIVITFSRALLFYFSTTSDSAHVSVRKHATSRKVRGVAATWAGAVCLVPGWKLGRHLLCVHVKRSNRNDN